MFHDENARQTAQSGNAVTISELIAWHALTLTQDALVRVALNALAQSGQVPTVRRLRALVGRGSLRDHCYALRVVNTAIDAFRVRDAVREPSPSEVEFVRLRQQLAETKAALVAKDEEFDGLRTHLLIETARQRDALHRDASAARQPQRKVIQPDFEEPIYAGRVDRSWK